MTEDPLEPLRLLREQAAGEPIDLPDELRRLYGGPLRLPRPGLVANFVATIDGVVAIPGLVNSNTLISQGRAADRFVMGLLRACADAVLVGSGTMAGSPGTLWTAERAYPPAAEGYAELRRRLGLPPLPEVAIVTASGLVDVAHPVLERGALVLTTEGGADALAGRLPAASQAVALPGAGSVDVRAAVSFLRGRGHGLILSEGGPTLFGSLLEAGLVDELFLTISPLLAGRSAGSFRAGLVEGAELLPALPSRSRLLGIRAHGDFLFLRYRTEPT